MKAFVISMQRPGNGARIEVPVLAVDLHKALARAKATRPGFEISGWRRA